MELNLLLDLHDVGVKSGGQRRLQHVFIAAVRVEERIAERIAGWEEVDIDEFLEVLFARLQSSKNRQNAPSRCSASTQN